MPAVSPTTQHLAFLDDSDSDSDSNSGGARVPRGAVAAGADLVVQSTHKTLTSLTQSGMLHQVQVAGRSMHLRPVNSSVGSQFAKILFNK